MAHNTTTTATTGEATAVDRRGLGRIRELDWRRYVIYIGFVVVFLFFAVLLGDEGFLSANNLLNIFRQTAMALSRWGLVAGVLAGLAVGLVIGSINGGLVSTLGIPSFLVTLGMLGIAGGIAQWITASAPQPILNDAYNLVFGSGNIGPIPGLLLWSAAFVVVGAVVLAKTRYGRQVLATGGNRTAAEFTGVNTRRIKFSVLLVSGVVAAIAGMLYAGRLQSGRFQWGTGDELSAIAAVILGGTSLFGGRGAVLRPPFRSPPFR